MFDNKNVPPSTMPPELIVLNVYNMYVETNQGATLLMPGCFHSAVEVYGTEYLFGRHHYPCSGIIKIKPRSGETYCSSYHFKLARVSGYTQYSRVQVQIIVKMLGDTDFTGDQYHLLTRNCNHFSQTFTKILGGQNIPLWVNCLATVGWIPVRFYKYVKYNVFQWPANATAHTVSGRPPASRNPTPTLTDDATNRRPMRDAVRPRLLAGCRTMPTRRLVLSPSSTAVRHFLSSTDTWTRRQPKQSDAPGRKHRSSVASQQRVCRHGDARQTTRDEHKN